MLSHVPGPWDHLLNWGGPCATPADLAFFQADRAGFKWWLGILWREEDYGTPAKHYLYVLTLNKETGSVETLELHRKAAGRK